MRAVELGACLYCTACSSVYTYTYMLFHCHLRAAPAILLYAHSFFPLVQRCTLSSLLQLLVLLWLLRAVWAMSEGLNITLEGRRGRSDNRTSWPRAWNCGRVILGRCRERSEHAKRNTCRASELGKEKAEQGTWWEEWVQVCVSAIIHGSV